MIETAVLISIKPKWVNLILSGKKTIEIRKTIPKLAPPFTCYIYERGTGMIVGEFVCDKLDCGYEWYGDFVSHLSGLHEPNFYGKSQIDGHTLYKYTGIRDFFTWHISSVKEYDTPLPVTAFKALCDYNGPCALCKHAELDSVDELLTCQNIVTKPPQSWRYVQKRVE